MIKIENLTKIYSGSSKPSANNISIEVSSGEIFGFIGPNGAGKSTTIKAIMGVIPFESGDIQIDGISIKKDPIAYKKKLGYVSDDHLLYEGLTGNEFINFICDIFDVEQDKIASTLERLVDMFELKSAMSNSIKTYSHGMKQKLNVIGALIHNPRVWILDEPMTGLDPKSAFNLKQLMNEHAEAGNIVFFSSHVLEVVEKICHRIGIIEDGNLILTSRVDELRKEGNESLEEIFMKLIDENVSSENSLLDKVE